MKVLKEIHYKGFVTIIKGEFTWNGWHGCHCVRYKYTISKDDHIIFKDSEVVVPEKPMKILFWTISKGITLKQAAEDELNDIVNYSKRYIDNLLYEKEMTDGLMDSLDKL